MLIERVPLDISGGKGMIERFKVRNDDGELAPDGPLDQLMAAADSMSKKAGALYELAQSMSDDKGVEGHGARLRFAESAVKAYNAVDKRMDEAMAVTFTEIARVQKAIEPPAPLNFEGAEIRAGLARLAPEARSKVLGEAEDKVIGAVHHAPSFLSGLTKSEREMYSLAWSNKRYPDESERLRRLGKALEAARKVGVSFKTYADGLVRQAQSSGVRTAQRVRSAQEALTAAE